MFKNHLPRLVSIALSLTLLALLAQLPANYVAFFQVQGIVASTTLVVLLMCVASVVFFITSLLLKLQHSYLSFIINLLISVACVKIIHVSSYLTWWLPILAFALLLVLLQSTEWLVYKWKNSLHIQRINHLLLNEFLSDYNCTINELYVNKNGTENQLFYSNGKTILVINEATNTLGETHVNLTALRLMSISKTRNFVYGVNFSLGIQFALFVAASYVYNFNYLIATQLISIILVYSVLSNIALLLLANLQQRFDVVYDILLYDNNINPQQFETFITNTYPTHNAGKRLHVIHNLEESQLAPYALPTHVSNYNAGLIIL
jgi:hypothetical protein